MKVTTLLLGTLMAAAIVALCNPPDGGRARATGDDSPTGATPTSLVGAASTTSLATPAPTPVLTRRGDVFALDGRPITPFGLRLANALQSDAIADRLIDHMDDMRAHGIQSFSLTIQGGRHTEGGNSAFNGYEPDGTLKPVYRNRLARILDAAAARRMVPVVVFFYRGRDQELDGSDAVRAAVRNTMEFLRPWRHLWVAIANEPYHDGYDQPLLTSADGYRELYRLAKEVDPGRIVYASDDRGANDGFVADTWGRAGRVPPAAGDVSIEYRPGMDEMDDPGIFSAEERERTRRDIEATARGGGYFFFHAAWHQKSDAPGWPRFDKGGAGTEADPGVAFAWDAMRAWTRRR
ncbi:MAG TPA: hypothetical protein VF158_03880 [Longimicrobiales bacterium]